MAAVPPLHAHLPQVTMGEWRVGAAKRSNYEDKVALDPLPNYRNELVDYPAELGVQNLVEFADFSRVGGVAVRVEVCRAAEFSASTRDMPEANSLPSSLLRLWSRDLFTQSCMGVVRQRAHLLLLL